MRALTLLLFFDGQLSVQFAPCKFQIKTTEIISWNDHEDGQMWMSLNGTSVMHKADRQLTTILSGKKKATFTVTI